MRRGIGAAGEGVFERDGAWAGALGDRSAGGDVDEESEAFVD